MTDDATTLLIQRIRSQLDQGAVQDIKNNSSLLASITSLIGTAANYAQILGTAGGPAAEAAAIAYVNDTVSGGVESAAGQAVLIGASAAAAGVGAAIVLIFSFVLAALSDTSASAETEALEQLGQEMNNLQQEFTNVGLGDYWQGKFTALQSFWDSPQGGIGTDLDNLANEGIGPNAVDVHNDVSHFHDHAIAFVNIFIPSKTPEAQIYWERPVLPNRAFTAQTVPYPSEWGFPNSAETTTMGWYGNLPQPQPAPSLGGPKNQMAADPRTMQPFLLLGIQSYLAIEMLLNSIDPGQPTFDQFVSQFSADLQDYANFIQSQYQLALNGILKSDLPSTADLIGFVDFGLGEDWALYVFPGYSGPQSNRAVATTGYVWNGVYGAVDTYPRYGFYQPSPPVPVPGAAPSYVIDVIDGSYLWPEWEQANIAPYEYLREATLADWVIPWLHNRLILGRTARWKAIYLLNGYDQVWSTIQKLRFLTNPSPSTLLANMKLDQDATIASGNWSTRELFSILNFDMVVDLDESYLPPYAASVFGLVAFLDSIANGNWVGAPCYSPGGSGPRRPVSLRSRLAAAASS